MASSDSISLRDGKRVAVRAKGRGAGVRTAAGHPGNLVETGGDTGQFPTERYFTRWAGVCAGSNRGAGEQQRSRVRGVQTQRWQREGGMRQHLRRSRRLGVDLAPLLELSQPVGRRLTPKPPAPWLGPWASTRREFNMQLSKNRPGLKGP